MKRFIGYGHKILVVSIMLIIGLSDHVVALSIYDNLDSNYINHLKTNLYQSNCVDIGPDGSIYFSDGSKIIKYKNGVSVVVAGTGVPSYSSPDGIPATQANLYQPSDVAVADDGTIYIADLRDRRVRKVSTDGIITTVAGTGDLYAPNTIENASDATQTTFANPYTVEVGPDGLLYVGDGSHIRRINADGSTINILNSINSQAPPYVDGGLAREQAFYADRIKVVFDSQGRMYATGYDGIFRIELDGRIYRIAGGGPIGGFDDRTVEQADINRVTSIAIDDNGVIYLAQDPSGTPPLLLKIEGGIVKRLAGGSINDPNGMSDARGKASEQRLPGRVNDIVIDHEGRLIFSDNGPNGNLLVLYSGIGDYLPPNIQPVLSIPVNTYGWHNETVAIDWEVNDPNPSSGIVVTPFGLSVSAEGYHPITSTHACDFAGNCSQGNAFLMIDKTLPSGTISSDIAVLINQKISGASSDNLSGIESVYLEVRNDNNSRTYSSLDNEISLDCQSENRNCSWTLNSSLSPGNYTITLKVKDFASNFQTLAAQKNLTVFTF